jgi:ATP-dependent helicase/nuclease subunit B
MEELLKPYMGLENWTSSSVLRDKKDGISGQVLLEIGKQYHTEYASQDALNSMQRIMHKIACAYVKMYLDYDMENYKAFRIIELENDEDYLLDFPITIDGKEEHVRLFGIIDRVDEVLTQDDVVKTRIVDYKTGGDSVTFRNLDKVFCANTENKALLQTLFYAYVFEQVTKRGQLEPHLYVARKMREEGTLFNDGKELLTGESLQEVKHAFIQFLRSTLEEIFDKNIPFKHNPDTTVYPSDPYTLFYRNAAALDEEATEP